MDKTKKPNFFSQPLALLDRYDYSIDISNNPPLVVVSIKVDSVVDVAIADLSTEINNTDGMAYVDGHIIKVVRFDLRSTPKGESVLYLFADLIK